MQAPQSVCECPPVGSGKAQRMHGLEITGSLNSHSAQRSACNKLFCLHTMQHPGKSKYCILFKQL